MTNIVALLSWYDERPADLRAMVASLPRAGVSTLVALDGAYALYPDGRAESPASNYETLERECRAHGIGLHIAAPDQPWQGNETQKRTALFRLGEQHTGPRDWFLIMDGDEEILDAPAELATHLGQTPLDVGEVTFLEPNTAQGPKHFPIPILFRAIRGIQVIGNHYTYRTPAGVHLWGNAAHRRLAARHPTGVLVLHKTAQRKPSRKAAAKAYYTQRDELDAERGACDRCTAPASRSLHTRWRPAAEGFVADWTEVCTMHALTVEAENRAALEGYGLDPDGVHVEHRLGPAPA